MAVRPTRTASHEFQLAEAMYRIPNFEEGKPMNHIVSQDTIVVDAPGF